MSVIDDYLKNVDPAKRAELERIRTIIKELVPDAEETIGYGMPVFKYNKKYLIGICAFKNHMSLFPGAEAIEALKDDLQDFKTAKGTIQFTLDKPVPKKLIAAVVTNRLNSIKQT